MMELVQLTVYYSINSFVANLEIKEGSLVLDVKKKVFGDHLSPHELSHIYVVGLFDIEEVPITTTKENPLIILDDRKVMRARIFEEIKPVALHKDPLYERTFSAQLLANTLLSKYRETAFMDASNGAGKTTLAYRFRELLEDWELKPQGFDRLMGAIYLQVQCRGVGLEWRSRRFGEADAWDITEPEEYDSHILKMLAHILDLSSRAKVSLDCSSVVNFIVSLSHYAGSRKFIFNFDSIGVFQHYGLEVGANMIYRIWRLSDALKSAGHFAILTGRSTLLRSIGLNPTRTGPFSSAGSAFMIPLPLLSDAAVRQVLADAKMLDRVEKDGLLSFIYKLCGGVPRAVYYAYSRYTHKPLHLFYEVDKYNMTNIWLDEADLALLVKCFQHCWVETDFTDSALLCGEPVSAVVARLGIFLQPSPRCDGTHRIAVPLYMYQRLGMSMEAVVEFAQGTDKGQQLEREFRSKVNEIVVE